jgi:hypothetical protein
MKQCTYCGREHALDATKCEIDGGALVLAKAKPAAVELRQHLSHSSGSELQKESAMLIPPLPRMESNLQSLKIDLEQGMENVLNTTGFISGIVFACAGLMVLNLPRSALADTLLPLLWISGGVLLAALVLRWITNVYLLIDPRKEALLEQSSFAKFAWSRKLIDHSSVATIGVRSRILRQKYSDLWEYQIVLVTRKGRMMRLGRPKTYPTPGQESRPVRKKPRTSRR